MLYLMDAPSGAYDSCDESQFVAAALSALDRLQQEHDGIVQHIAQPIDECLMASSPLLAEICALATLVTWEGAGHSSVLSEMPRFQQAAEDLRHRIREFPREFMHSEPASPSLHRQVNAIRSRRFHFDFGLKAELIILDADEDALVDCIAELIWKLRHKNRNLTTCKKLPKDWISAMRSSIRVTPVEGPK